LPLLTRKGLIMVATDTLSSSLEDYIETILHLVAEKRVARVKDIAQRMGVKSSSVTGALRSLAKRKLVNYTPYDVITLTSKGERFARDVVRRHEAIRTFFVNVLGVDEKEADEVACKMEHSISRPILERTIGFAEFVEICPRAGTKWLKEISRGCERGENVEECERCVASVLKEIRAEKRRGF